MNKNEFVTVLAERCEVTKVDAEEMYNNVFGVLAEVISEGHEVAVTGLGKFKIVERDARTARNPKTGNVVDVPAKKVPKFQFSKNIKEAVADL